MDNVIRIVVDAMGGDLAPIEPVKGAVAAVNAETGFIVVLVGKEGILQAELNKYTYPKERIIIRPASEVIGMNEHPVEALRGKKDSSITVGLTMVRNHEGDGFVSAGSTGAVIAGAQFIIGRQKGIKRSPLATLIPTEKGVSLLIDCGANVDARPEQLVSFAKMGSIYMESVLKKQRPTVGLVNIGAEDEKGNVLVQETLPRLRACEDLNFIGSVESRDIPGGACDVVVTDAFTGNVILKLYEGLASTLMGVIKKGLMSTLKSKIGGVLIKPALKKTLKQFDASEYGGAPLLGLKGLVIKTHGSSTSKEIKNSILQCRDFFVSGTYEKITEAIAASRNPE